MIYQLKDKESEVINLYLSGKTINEIKEILHLKSDKPIYTVLNKNSIQRRKSSDYRKPAYDEQKIVDYYKQILNTKSTANYFDLDPSTIRNILKRNNFVFQRSLPNNDPLINLDLEILNGCLLGDGWLDVKNKNSDVCGARFNHCTVVEGYRDFLQASLSFKTKASSRKRKEEWQEVFELRSSSNTQLRELHRQWNITEKKAVPRNLVLTPTTCLFWYIDDGCLSIINNKNGTTSGVITLYTNDFDQECVDFLVDSLRSLGFSCSKHIEKRIKVGKEKQYPIIRINQSSTRDFLKYIGDCPVEGFAYKWRLQDFKC